LSYAYRDWCRWKGFDYDVQKFKEEQHKLPYIPTENELDQLIAGFSPKYAAFLQLLKETGFRSIEARRLTPRDVDLVRGIVTLNNPAKGSRPRQFKLSTKLQVMLAPFVKKLKPNETIWSAKANSVRSRFSRTRNRIAKKLGNPRLTRITLHTFRHWKATTEYHRTKDILYVKNLLGHRDIKNTLVYTHLVNFEEDSYIVKIASSINEFTKLLESGFEFVSDYDDKKILRKRK
jgi:integrase